MKEVRYVGPHDAVLVPMPDGREPVISNGEVLKTSDEHAASLLEQEGNWELAKPAKSGKEE